MTHYANYSLCKHIEPKCDDGQFENSHLFEINYKWDLLELGWGDGVGRNESCHFHLRLKFLLLTIFDWNVTGKKSHTDIW